MNFLLPYCTCDRPSALERREAAEYGTAVAEMRPEGGEGDKKFGKPSIPV